MGNVERVYDLEERTFLFAKNVRGFVKSLDKNICKKEIKETILWLRLFDIETEELEKIRTSLIQEATELKNIFGAIYKNSITKIRI